MKIKDIKRIRGINLTEEQEKQLLTILEEDGKAAILGIVTIRKGEERKFSKFDNSVISKTPYYSSVSPQLKNKLS